MGHILLVDTMKGACYVTLCMLCMVRKMLEKTGQKVGRLGVFFRGFYAEGCLSKKIPWFDQ